MWINEFHYDNRAEGDGNEFIEVGCNANIGVTGYKIIRYNGKNENTYGAPLELDGICSPTRNNFIVVDVTDADGLQNGAPDGLALIDDQNNVIEFISYEGSFTAANGPAEGMTSQDVGVSESNSNAEGLSLQLMGTGCDRSDFEWRGNPIAQTKGTLNNGQSIVCSSAPTPTPTLTPTLTPTPTPTITTTITQVWINEFDDQEDFIEIGCNAEVDMAGYQIYLYDGRTEQVYDSKLISGICSPSAFLVEDIIINDGRRNRFNLSESIVNRLSPSVIARFMLFPRTSRGIALVDGLGDIMEFISYEGSFLGVDGPAKGVTSTQVPGNSGVFKDGLSFQLIGSGCNRSDFNWNESRMSQTKGQLNVDQTVLPGEECEGSFGEPTTSQPNPPTRQPTRPSTPIETPRECPYKGSTDLRLCGEARCGFRADKDITSLDALDKYYSATFDEDGEVKRGAQLKNALNSIIRGHRNVGYDCVWKALEEIYKNGEDNILLFYTKRSIPRLQRDCGLNPDGDRWNKEHLFVKNRGFKNIGMHAHNDIHHLVPTDKSVNRDRNGKDFEEGGEEHPECCNCKWDGINDPEGQFEPPNGVKGQIARIMFYMEVRYDGSDNDSVNGPNLQLVDERTKTNEVGKMGKLSNLKKWHCQYKVSQEERDRNDIIQSWQGNRNPFIDRPEFVERAWNFSCDELLPNRSDEL